MNPPVYHFTSLHNLQNIAASRQIFCKNLSRNLLQTDVSDQDIQMRRSKKIMPFHGGNLHDYVPFYFNPRSPMMYRVTDGGRKGEWFIVFRGQYDHLSTCCLSLFSNVNASCRYAKFTNNSRLLKDLDWDAINCRYWGNRGDARAAEFLVKGAVPLIFLDTAFVGSRKIQVEVEELFESTGYKDFMPNVEVNREALFLK